MKTKKMLLKNSGLTSPLLLALLATSQICCAATHYLDFYNTIVAANSGPVNPANGAVSISGTNLLAGDVVVFDGVATSQNPTGGVDQWAAINLNGSGFDGVTQAALGVEAETGDGFGSSQLFPWATAFGDSGADVNHIRIELTATTSGSTTNMTYRAEVDPYFTETFYPLTGTVTFPNNIITLSFGANAQSQEVDDTSGALAIAATPTNSPLLLDGMTQTFTAMLAQGLLSDPNYTFSFQWLSNNVPIDGANGQTYITAPITAANNGDLYTVILLTNSVYAVTSAPAVLNYHANPVTWVLNFANTNWTGGGAGVFTPVMSRVYNTYLAAGDTVVFDGFVIGTGPWGGVGINGSGLANITGAGLESVLKIQKNPIFGGGLGDCSTIKMHKHAISY